MDITICDDAFIDLIHSCTADEIAALESSVDDLESELRDKAGEDYVDALTSELRAEWQQEIKSAIDNIEVSSVDSLEDEVNDLAGLVRVVLEHVDQTQMSADRRIRTLETQVAELDLAFSALTQSLAQPGVIRRAYNSMLALSSKINWYSPKL